MLLWILQLQWWSSFTTRHNQYLQVTKNDGLRCFVCWDMIPQQKKERVVLYLSWSTPKNLIKSLCQAIHGPIRVLCHDFWATDSGAGSNKQLTGERWPFQGQASRRTREERIVVFSWILILVTEESGRNGGWLVKQIVATQIYALKSDMTTPQCKVELHGHESCCFY